MLPSVSDVDWTKLSGRAKRALDQIALPLRDGETFASLEDKLGVDRKTLQDELDHLGSEVRALAGERRLPDLTVEEYESLRDSIEAYGQIFPVLVDATGWVIDGKHRLRACAELGREPVRRVLDVDADTRAALALVVNVARRHLTAGARRGLIEAELIRDPERSDRSVAAVVGASPSTVGTVRRELEDRNRVSKLDTRRGSDGVRQPASKPRIPVRAVGQAREIPVAELERAHVYISAELLRRLVDGWVTCQAVHLEPSTSGYTLAVIE